MMIVYALIFLGLIVIFHELGHFISAKIVGIEVEEFSIGMGPQILKIDGKRTTFSLRALPLGGYVRYFDEFEDSGDPRAFSNASVWKRLIVITSGPLMNFILAVIILSGFFMITGYNDVMTVIDTVFEDGASYNVLMPDDDIIAIEGEAIEDGYDGVLRFKDIIYSNDKETYNITVNRSGRLTDVEITPNMESDTPLGIQFGVTNTKLSLFPATGLAIRETGRILGALADYIRQIFRRGPKVGDLMGPVGIVNEIGRAAKEGMTEVLNLVILITINLGLVNLMPLPALDGGRLIIYLVEAVRGKPIDKEKEGMFHLVGFVLLILLVVVVTFNDIFRLQ